MMWKGFTGFWRSVAHDFVAAAAQAADTFKSGPA
jgi:hypothetical protein